MGLFSKKKEEKTTTGCCCGGTCETGAKKTSRFIVLGACCKKSTEAFENAKIAVKELGFVDEVLNIGDAVEIANYGVMSTPALVVDGKVVSVGKALTVQDVKKLLENVNR